MTTSRTVVVLRSELGRQLSLAQKQFDKIDKEFKESGELDRIAKGGRFKNSPTEKEWSRLKGVMRRLEIAAHALGALQLGDIEDKEL